MITTAMKAAIRPYFDRRGRRFVFQEAPGEASDLRPAVIHAAQTLTFT